jgi:hypothetical protein
VPAPAKVNSMMSAGPETAAKLLAEAGYKIWLHTKVEYLNSSTNALDFTSVVPKRIDMEWGVVGVAKPSGTWGTDIELPVAPLQGAAAKEYEDWDKAKTAALVKKLRTETGQVRAQAFDLVKHDDLKWAILHAFPDTYLNMEDRTKGAILKAMPDKALNKLMKALKVNTSPDGLIEQVILPLAAVGETARLQDLFNKLPKDVQREMIVSYKGDLLQHLGATAEALSKTDWTVFNYNSDAAKANLLNSMSKAEISTFLGQRTYRQKKELFSLWAEKIGGFTNAAKMADFVDGLGTVEGDYKVEFRTAMEKEIEAQSYVVRRPSRKYIKKSGPY